jgi:hypothetical protein
MEGRGACGTPGPSKPFPVTPACPSSPATAGV